MPGVPRLQQIQRRAVADFTDDDPVRPKAARIAHEVVHGDYELGPLVGTSRFSAAAHRSSALTSVSTTQSAANAGSPKWRWPGCSWPIQPRRVLAKVERLLRAQHLEHLEAGWLCAAKMSRDGGLCAETGLTIEIC
jgi:hypothetical protein